MTQKDLHKMKARIEIIADFEDLRIVIDAPKSSTRTEFRPLMRK